MSAIEFFLTAILSYIVKVLTVCRHLGMRHLSARTFGRAKTFGRKTFGCKMRGSALITIIFLLLCI